MLRQDVLALEGFVDSNSLFKVNTFFDFCAGIGGGRIALESSGLECLGFSEIDKQAEASYRLFFGSREKIMET